MLYSFNNDHSISPVISFCWVEVFVLCLAVFSDGTSQHLAGSERKVSLWNTSNSDLLMASPLFLNVTSRQYFHDIRKGKTYYNTQYVLSIHKGKGQQACIHQIKNMCKSKDTSKSNNNSRSDYITEFTNK